MECWSAAQALDGRELGTFFFFLLREENCKSQVLMRAIKINLWLRLYRDWAQKADFAQERPGNPTVFSPFPLDEPAAIAADIVS